MNTDAKQFRFAVTVTFLDVSGNTRQDTYEWVDSDLSSPLKVARDIAVNGFFLPEDLQRSPPLSFALIPPHRILMIEW